MATPDVVVSELTLTGATGVELTNAEIADARGVSLRTVETQRAQVMHRLGRHTRAELVQYALELGIVDSET